MPGSADLMEMYRSLLATFGPRRWWPAEGHFEMMVGAVLTQNTSWHNVVKALDNLKRAGCLRPRKIFEIDPERLAELIRPAGYYNLKARRLKNFVAYIVRHHRGSPMRMLATPAERLRSELLKINGVGRETADCILLYAARHPIFVVDAYTGRVMARHGLISADASYDEIQSFFHRHLPPDEKLYNEYHALLVEVGKRFCRRRARCRGCPLEHLLA